MVSPTDAAGPLDRQLPDVGLSSRRPGTYRAWRFVSSAIRNFQASFRRRILRRRSAGEE
jgi:hypothetical protein